MLLITYVMNTILRDPYKRFFGTLANQYRIDIIEILKNGPKTVTQLCQETKFNQSTISHNLKRLQECGFVFVKPRGKERIYNLNQKTIKPLLNLMDEHMENYCSKLCH